MSDYHIMQQEDSRKTVRVVFHIPIPDAGTNEAGLSWRQAIVRDQGGAAAIESGLPDISAEEDSALKAGEIFESPETVRFSSVNLTNAQRLAQIETAFGEVTSALVAEKVVTLEWIGLTGDV